MADTSGILARLQASLSVYDPTWDVGVGSATYKILESVASEIALANNNSTLQTYSYNINTKYGIELDAFCNLFGVYRQLGKRATGVVTFTINTASANIIDIPVGTQVAVPIGTNYTSALYYSTTAPAIIGVGDTSVDVPVVSTLPGAIGNVPAGVVTNLFSNIVGVTSVLNNAAITGGLDPESDSSLRARWQNSAFRNNTGTPGKYTITALQDPNVSLVNTVSQQSFYNEQLQIDTVISGSNPFTLLLVAYSGMTSVVSGTTFSGTTVVASTSFVGNPANSVLASGINAMVSGVAPNNSVIVSTSGTSVASGVLLTYSNPLPYNMILGSGTTIPNGGVTVSGVTTISGVSLYNFIQSNNPDVGLSGTLSYNGTFSGYLFPQGNELVGNGLSTYSQIVFANLTDYYYPNNPVAPLQINIANNAYNTELFAGNSVQLVSEYNPASSRSVALTSGNFVDIFINGTTANTVSQQVVFNPTFSGTVGNAVSYLNLNNYVCASGSSAASNSGTVGDIYVPLGQQPVINFPAQLSTANSGIADVIYVYNTLTSSGTTYPICINPYNYITFTGTVISGANASGNDYFISVNNASSFIPTGLALASGVLTSGTQYYITNVTTSGIFLNQPTTAPSGSNTTVVMSGKSIVYPLYDTTNTQKSVLDMSGLFFDTSTPPTGWPALPTGLTWAQYGYSYNGDVSSVESLVQQSRPFGTNTLVHQASFINLNINVRIVLTNGYSQASVESSAVNTLSAYLNGLSYLNVISFSNLTAQFLTVNGISNVRVTSVNTVALDGTITGTYTGDFSLASNQLPNLYSIGFTIKGNSNF